jgi:hypothetical protein
MSPIKIALLSAGLFAATASSAMADGFRYAGSPKFGQFYVRDQASVARSLPGRSGSSLRDARAQHVEAPRYMPKGGIASRGP